MEKGYALRWDALLAGLGPERKRAMTFLREHLPQSDLDCYPAELSIGECRRVELARALINSPPILVLDEITANLDDDNIWDMFQLLEEVNRQSDERAVKG